MFGQKKHQVIQFGVVMMAQYLGRGRNHVSTPEVAPFFFFRVVPGDGS